MNAQVAYNKGHMHLRRIAASMHPMQLICPWNCKRDNVPSRVANTCLWSFLHLKMHECLPKLLESQIQKVHKNSGSKNSPDSWPGLQVPLLNFRLRLNKKGEC